MVFHVPNGPTIDDEFPGGNIRVLGWSSDTRTLVCGPDLRDTEGYWFYWNARFAGPCQQSMTVQFASEEWPAIGDAGPAFSRDGGQTWYWAGRDAVAGNSFHLPPLRRGETIQCAVAIPYTDDDLNRFLQNTYRGILREDSGIPGEGPTLSTIVGTRRSLVPTLLITARHHACESMASFVLEGILERAIAAQRLLSPNYDDPDIDVASLGWRQASIPIIAVPFVDYQGVQNGDQGKNRLPHDHNRDYREQQYPGVRQVARIVRTAQHPLICLDLHCPYLTGGDTNNHVYLVGKPHESANGEAKESRVREFAAALAQNAPRSVPIRPFPYLPHGHDWNTLSQPISFAGWAQRQTNVLFASTIEVPYAVVDGTTITEGDARELGRAVYNAVLMVAGTRLQSARLSPSENTAPSRPERSPRT